jgi:inner membrane protein involved in colicin E2 resistance
MYLFCYMMLTTSTYALLLGSLILFFALAAIMYASLKVKRI